METPAFIEKLFAEHYLSKKWGFLCDNPVARLPYPELQQWHEICDRIVDLLEQNKYRATIDNELDVLDYTVLQTREEKFCAVALLTHMGKFIK